MTQTPFFAQGQSSAPCWFVGAMINRGDDARVLAQVRTMQTGERIAIKAATRRKAGLVDSTDKTRRACYS